MILIKSFWCCVILSSFFYISIISFPCFHWIWGKHIEASEASQIVQKPSPYFSPLFVCSHCNIQCYKTVIVKQSIGSFCPVASGASVVQITQDQQPML